MRILTQAENVCPPASSPFSGLAISKIQLKMGGVGKAMNALIRFKNVAPLFIIALSLVSATATTTDVIFSFDETDGEYAYSAL